MRYYGENSTIGLIIIIDFLVLTPTLKKLWINPKSEDSLAWVMAAISQACLILSIENMNFASVGYIVYLTLVNASVALLIYRRRLYLGYWWNRMKNMLPKIAIKRRFW